VKIQVDKKADALYLSLTDVKVKESEEDFNHKGEVVGIEILGVKKRISKDDLRKIQFEID
jgi:uncharacterized protein YuzE